MKKTIGQLLILALLVSGGTLAFAQQAARTEKTMMIGICGII